MRKIINLHYFDNQFLVILLNKNISNKNKKFRCVDYNLLFNEIHSIQHSLLLSSSKWSFRAFIKVWIIKSIRLCYFDVKILDDLAGQEYNYKLQKLENFWCNAWKLFLLHYNFTTTFFIIIMVIFHKPAISWQNLLMDFWKRIIKFEIKMFDVVIVIYHLKKVY